MPGAKGADDPQAGPGGGGDSQLSEGVVIAGEMQRAIGLTKLCANVAAGLVAARWAVGHGTGEGTTRGAHSLTLATDANVRAGLVARWAVGHGTGDGTTRGA